ncbi:MAG: ABC transporter permease [Anaerolineae bacterium]|nr:ABC transporter permease [Anaerolineae bacterium]
MTKYIIRRLLQAIPLLWIISVIVFLLLQIIPGGPMAAYEQNPNITPEDMARLEEQLGLNDPIHVKYLKWLGNILRGDWGYSLATKRPVLQEIGDRLPNTLLLMGVAFMTTILFSLPIGIFSALRQYSIFDHVVTTIAFMGQSIPIFWFGLILIMIFHVGLRNPVTGRPLFPARGMVTLGKPFSPGDLAWHMVLPVTMLTLFGAGTYTRYMRSSMLEVIHLDYIRTARAKGLAERTVIYVHALKNAALPVVTIIALDLPGLFGGALFTETIFSWPGMGRLFYRSAERVDYAMLMAIIMINAALIIFFNLLADIAYAYLDPRIRYD